MLIKLLLQQNKNCNKKHNIIKDLMLKWYIIF